MDFSITESPNELTKDIDIASPEEIVRLLRTTDGQIYNGYGRYPGLCDEGIVDKIVRVVNWAAPLVGHRDAMVILSGAGTSGRLAMFLSRTFNQFLTKRTKSANFRYLVAGGQRALIKAQEGAEDDPHQAWEDLRPLIYSKQQVLYVGITCGLTAPYVASQLWHLSSRRNARCVLIGFNPANCARDTEVENWDKTFADVVDHVCRKKNTVILNPIIGPEAITGSTRMKGGSATKLLLEIIFSLAAYKKGLVKSRFDKLALTDAVKSCIQAYEHARITVYKRSADMASLIEYGERSLRNKRHIYYIGSGPPGILGLIDASECPPTFGAEFEDVRGYLVGGWRTLLGPGCDLSDEGPCYRISVQDFLSDNISNLTQHDLVVGLPFTNKDKRIQEILRRARKAKATTAAILPHIHSLERISPDVIIQPGPLPRSILPGRKVFEEYATKLVLNALTTGAHVLSGKVYQNRMIDLKISNNKLYHRAISIIRNIAGVDAKEAKRALLHSIYHLDKVKPSLLKYRVSKHICAANDVIRVVPRALIMASRRVSYAQADQILADQPVVRLAIQCPGASSE
ncbi:MAG: hypothetical protein ACYTF1_05565 [Planctomycetota bacterium]|jgi:N-acetylmuramic acid 6-phosphate (MurNAc-6-P) etherase